MDVTSLKESIKEYEEKLRQVESALTSAEGNDSDDLVALKNDLLELINLTKQSLSQMECPDEDDEYATFMAEMKKEGAIEDDSNGSSNLEEEFKSLEGTKCRAPYRHQRGNVLYYNAMICSVHLSEDKDYDNMQVKVFFINPTNQEMLPCPYFLEGDCKFSDEKCRFSHGDLVLFKNLQEYTEPDFSSLSIGSTVLTKQADKLWHKGTVKRILKDKCSVVLDSSAKDVEVDLHDVLPLENDEESSSSSSEEDAEENGEVINMSLMNAPSGLALGEWEKHTKGIGSKLMAKMGYVIGTGLGRHKDGIIDPVTAVILPAGKSLDHCMQLRENAGGDKNLFSAERKLKRLQRRQEVLSRKAYEREKNRTDVFNFMNENLSVKRRETHQEIKSNHRKEIKDESRRSLNVASLQVEEDIKRCERDLWRINESLTRHTDDRSQMHRNLKMKRNVKMNELKILQAKAVNIKNEQNVRNDKKKLTIF